MGGISYPPGGSAVIPDPLFATVIHRVDSLGNLLALSGNPGEIMVPNNARGMVVQQATGTRLIDSLKTVQTSFSSSTITKTPTIQNIPIPFTPSLVTLYADINQAPFNYGENAAVGKYFVGQTYFDFLSQTSIAFCHGVSPAYGGGFSSSSFAVPDDLFVNIILVGVFFNVGSIDISVALSPDSLLNAVDNVGFVGYVQG